MTETLVPLGLIDDNPFQTRQSYDEAGIAELAADIYARGLLQTPAGRRVEGRVQLAFGHRRLRAYRHIRTQIDPLGWAAMPVNLQEFSDEQMALAAWSENAQRKDLTPIEEAQAIQRMAEQFGWSQAEIGGRLGIDRSTVANKLRLLRLPADVQAQVMRRELSERQAMALLPLYDLPPALLKNFAKEHPYSTRPDQVLAEAPRWTSDRIRNDVERVIRDATNDISPLWADHVFDDRHVKAPACNACSERIRCDGKLRCPVGSCYNRKQEAWETLRLAAAHIVCGIRPVEKPPHWEEYATLQHVPQPQRILEKRCPNLRLRWVGKDHGVSRLLVDGYSDVEIICLHVKDNKCNCATQAKAAATREANLTPDVQALRLERKRIDEELIGPAEAAIAEALRADQLGVWQALMHKIVFSNVSDPDTVGGCREKIAHALLGDTVGQWLRVERPDYGTLKNHATRKLESMGIAAPWGELTPLDALRQRYEGPAWWVTHRQWWRDFDGIKVEAIHGNLDNLNRLLQELAELRDRSDEALALESEIAIDRDLLLRVQPVAGEMAARGWHYLRPTAEICTRLLEAEPGSVVFEQALAQADPLALRYVIAVAQGFERIDALYKRLRELELEPLPAL